MMQSHEGKQHVFLTGEAVAALNRLEAPLRGKVKKKLEALGDLRPARAVRRHPDVHILRVADYRALYLIDQAAKAKMVFFIGSHKEYEKKYLLMFG